MAVVGLGVIGIEIGQALSRLGVEVFGFTIDKAIGGLSDPALQDYAAKTFSAEFNISYNGVELVGERDGQLLVRSEDGERLVDKIFLTMGRAPSLKGLGLENLGLETDQRGLPKFDPNTFLIPNTRIFLVGDANGERNILHEAADEGRIAGYNAVRADSECFQRRTLLAITFSDPNIAIVGKGYRELKAKNIDFIVGKVSYEGFGRAIIMLKEKGLVHIYGDKKSGRILGAEIIAPSGKHLAHLLSWVISLGLSAHDVLALPFYHPVLEEGLRSALRDLARQLQSAPPGLEVLRCQDPPAGTQV